MPENQYITIAKSINLKGVACPLNFVKTKLALETLEPGQILQVVLDKGEPMRNVPRSVKDEGHQIIYTKKEKNHYILLIRKS